MLFPSFCCLFFSFFRSYDSRSPASRRSVHTLRDLSNNNVTQSTLYLPLYPFVFLYLLGSVVSTIAHIWSCHSFVILCFSLLLIVSLSGFVLPLFSSPQALRFGTSLYRSLLYILACHRFTSLLLHFLVSPVFTFPSLLNVSLPAAIQLLFSLLILQPSCFSRRLPKVIFYIVLLLLTYHPFVHLLIYLTTYLGPRLSVIILFIFSSTPYAAGNSPNVTPNLLILPSGLIFILSHL